MPDDNEIGPLAHTIDRIKANNPSLSDIPTGDINNTDRQVTVRDEHGRFVPGVSGNPKGYPGRKNSLPDCIRSELEKIDPKTGKTNAQLIADQVMKRAIAGDKQMIEIALDYVTGKPVQSINQQLLGAVQLNVQYEDNKRVDYDMTQATECP